MTAQPPRALIVKIGSEGDVYLNFKPASVEQMRAALHELNQVSGVVIYYRESPYRDASDAASATFQHLVELKPRIMLGTKAPSEWGQLDWVEVQRSPAIARVFIARGQKYLISPEPTVEHPKGRVLVGGPLQSETEDRILQEIDLLIRADRVLETPGIAPQLAMDEQAMKAPSLHLRLAYATRRWASAYPADAIPSNIASFYNDLLWFAGRTFGQAAERGQKLTGAEALNAIKETGS